MKIGRTQGAALGGLSSGGLVQDPMDPEPLCLALQATGAGIVEAVQQLRNAYPDADLACLPALLAWAEREIRDAAGRPHPLSNETTALECVLLPLLEADPALANAAFGACQGMTLDGRVGLTECGLDRLPEDLKIGKRRGPGVTDCFWLNNCTSLTRLAKGLEVQGMLVLNGCTALESLPDGLKVGEDLSLQGCASLVALPAGLKIGRVDLRGCTSWDGIIPADAKIGYILTDQVGNTGGQHDLGVSLDHWRLRFGDRSCWNVIEKGEGRGVRHA